MRRWDEREDLQEPGDATAGEHPGHLHQVLQQRAAALAARRQPLDPTILGRPWWLVPAERTRDVIRQRPSLP